MYLRFLNSNAVEYFFVTEISSAIATDGIGSADTSSVLGQSHGYSRAKITLHFRRSFTTSCIENIRVDDVVDDPHIGFGYSVLMLVKNLSLHTIVYPIYPQGFVCGLYGVNPGVSPGSNPTPLNFSYTQLQQQDGDPADTPDAIATVGTLALRF
jgi:hypothetical protein